jgi:hypothetical protein
MNQIWQNSTVMITLTSKGPKAKKNRLRQNPGWAHRCQAPDNNEHLAHSYTHTYFAGGLDYDYEKELFWNRGAIIQSCGKQRPDNNM